MVERGGGRVVLVELEVIQAEVRWNIRLGVRLGGGFEMGAKRYKVCRPMWPLATDGLNNSQCNYFNTFLRTECGFTYPEKRRTNLTTTPVSPFLFLSTIRNCLAFAWP